MTERGAARPSATARRRVHRAAAVGTLSALLALPTLAQPAIVDDVPRSPRNASYQIEVHLDPSTRVLTGRQVVTWRNIQQRPTRELRFHLYWNAWRNDRSTWMLEDRLRGRSELDGKTIRDEDWGFLDIDSARLLSPTGVLADDLLPGLRFVSPDDGNPYDRTVAVVPLPWEVAPGETIDVELTWRARVPRPFARTGVRGDYYFLAHWFPKLGVFEETGWNCHQYHSATEYFSDYGVYRVEITLPSRFVVGATGRRIDLQEHLDGTSTHVYDERDVHAFTWTASPDYLVFDDRFESPGLPPVDLRLLLQPEHRAQKDRHLAATRAALENYGKWFGPYPYGHVTIVDPAWGSGAGGMEYPTLFTCGSRWLNPFGGGSPEGVTIHEAGHQFWYGIVGNNEFEHAWLDEGLNSFSEARVYEVAYGAERHVERYMRLPGVDRSGFLPWIFDELQLTRAVHGNGLPRYRRTPRTDVQALPTWRYYPGTAGSISYSKTSLWLATLERYLGWETTRRALSTFFVRWQFRHPRPEDFFAAVDEAAGRDMSWFFRQVYHRSEAFDYEVRSVASFPAAPTGWVDDGAGGSSLVTTPRAQDSEAPEGETLFRSEVVVWRNEAGVFPVDVLLVFEDGSEVRRHWDGRDRWMLLTEERPTKLRYAEVDPDRVLLLDLDHTNNSRLREARNLLPAAKWASKWMVWLQDLLYTFSYYS